MMPSFSTEENPFFGGMGRGMADEFHRIREGDMLSQIVEQAGGADADPSDLISGILGSSLDPETKKSAISTFAQQQKAVATQAATTAKAEADAKKEAGKPGVIATERLKSYGKKAEKLPGIKADLNRALELIDEGVVTGPLRGLTAEKTPFASNLQKELKGIAARALTENFDVLPRIVSEFESFKSGQISLTNPPEVNKRIIKQQLKAADLADAKIKRIGELTDTGVSEAAALRQVDKEFDKKETALVKEIRSSNKAATAAGKKTKEDAIAEARRRGIMP